MTTHHHRIRYAVAGAGLAALALVGSLDAAGAAPKPKAGVLSHDSGGTFTTNAGGGVDVVATGSVYRGKKGPQPVQVTATMAADDGTLPDPGACEPGTATMTLLQDGALVAELTGSGEVCGRWIQPPTYYVTHVYTGRYVVTAGEHRLVGTDGWYQVILGQGGTAGLSSYDT